MKVMMEETTVRWSRTNESNSDYIRKKVTQPKFYHHNSISISWVFDRATTATFLLLSTSSVVVLMMATMVITSRASVGTRITYAHAWSQSSLVQQDGNNQRRRRRRRQTISPTTNIGELAMKRFSQSSASSSSLSSASDPTTNQREQKQAMVDAYSKLQLAPMMDYTDRHMRYMVRLVSQRTLLWTEMIAANTLAYEKREQISNMYDNGEVADSRTNDVDNYSDEFLRRYLGQAGKWPSQQTSTTESLIKIDEGPCVLQLGGSSPDLMAEATQTVMDMTDRGWCDYTALNLNVGCPSPKVAGKGCFGAALMDDPLLVKDLCRAMHDGCNGKLPVSVKCRIGTDTHMDGFTKDSYASIDDETEYKRLCKFIETVASDGIVRDFSVHARIAVLKKSFSPADNRKVPPLKYGVVRRLVADYPELRFTINGGIDTIEHAKYELEQCPGLVGVMTGRAWAADPWSFSMADHLLYDDVPVPERSRWDILNDYAKYADEEERHNDPVKIRRFIVKAIQTLFTGEPRAKKYRIALDEFAGLPKKLHQQGKSLDGQPPISELILNAAMEHLSEDVLYRTPQESYERKIRQEKRRMANASGSAADIGSGSGFIGRSAAITEWQSDRQSEREREKAKHGEGKNNIASDSASTSTEAEAIA